MYIGLFQIHICHLTKPLVVQVLHLECTAVKKSIFCVQKKCLAFGKSLFSTFQETAFYSGWEVNKLNREEEFGKFFFTNTKNSIFRKRTVGHSNERGTDIWFSRIGLLFFQSVATDQRKGRSPHNSNIKRGLKKKELDNFRQTENIDNKDEGQFISYNVKHNIL